MKYSFNNCKNYIQLNLIIKSKKSYNNKFKNTSF